MGPNINLVFGPGDTGLLNPGDAHEDLQTRLDRDYLTVNIKKGLFEEIIQDLGCTTRELPCFLTPKLEADPTLKRVCEALRSEVDGQDYGREILVRNLVGELAIHFLRSFSPSVSRLDVFDSDHATARWQVRKALEYLHDTYAQEFSLDRIAAAAGLSKYYLERVFKKATGLPPHTYMLMLRIEAAKKLLASSSMPIAEIAMELGFSDQSHFTNAFKRRTGFTPQTYRLGTK
jgi:AraC family transcriptional regulator